CQHTYGAPFTF
nr:immunoglobulin light chain junction region [Macaca mulatta]MOW53136.1 immunoglobulin light chain junction region [Macaca mulatta]MOW55815.1 immunoglobulin light chain junction region [Macaca mulatta]MOX26708.1 immunoglobulin light chain junction region [Macaca mulatta]MOX26733.1 immunoglobulin light chain junction region [Macaca mulatta]